MDVLTNKDAERRIATIENSIADFEAREASLSDDELWVLGRLRMRRGALRALLDWRRRERAKKVVSLEPWRRNPGGPRHHHGPHYRPGRRGMPG